MRTKFQYILIGVFIFLAVLGVFGFAGILPLPKPKQSVDESLRGQIVIWGTEDQAIFNAAYRQFAKDVRPSYTISYEAHPADTFDSDLVNAIASGHSPDAILLPQDHIIRYRDKIYPIPFSAYSEREYQDTFIGEGDLFLEAHDTLALPFIIDPMVMYWNRDLLATAGVAEPPTTWDEFYGLVPKLTIADQSLTISQSAFAFGEYRNVTHAKDILALLMMQGGDPIVAKAEGNFYSGFGTSSISALQFYTSFSDPTKSSYAWNLALPDSKDMFLNGNLAFYFGYASEASDLAAKNPHLDFAVAPMPQPQGAQTSMTFGAMQGLALLKSSPNLALALPIIIRMTQADYLGYFENASGLPPVRRDMLANKPSETLPSVFYDEALISHAWLDPSPTDTDTLFQEMIENVTSGRDLPIDAVKQGNVELTYLLAPLNGSATP